jgi:high-affinity nickel permease
LIAEQLHLEGRFWNIVADMNANLGVLGFVIVGFFMFCWIGAVILHWSRGLDGKLAAAGPESTR